MLRTLLLELAKSSRLRRWITSNGATRRMAHRFVPGEELAPAIEAARACNKAGMTVSLDHLGENVVTREDAERARASYTEALDQIAARGDRGKRLAEADASRPRPRRGILRGAVAHRHAPRGGTRKFRARGYGRLGVYRPHLAHGQAGPRGNTLPWGPSSRHISTAAKRISANCWSIGCRIRLVKGAYKEPSRIAFRRKKDVDANFIKLMKILLPSGIYHALATHDPKMIEAAIRFAAEQNITKDKFEFQMLYGIRTDLQSSPGAAGISRPRVHSVREGLVSIFHAPAGGTARELGLLREKFFSWGRAHGLVLISWNRLQPVAVGPCRAETHRLKPVPHERKSNHARDDSGSTRQTSHSPRFPCAGTTRPPGTTSSSGLRRVPHRSARRGRRIARIRNFL